jgi:hypothetical protein
MFTSRAVWLTGTDRMTTRHTAVYVVGDHVVYQGVSMGASGWDYRVPFAGGLRKSFAAVQEQELADDGYLWPWETFAPSLVDYEAPARPTSMAELDVAKQMEAFWDAGTHSILDLDRMIAGDGDEVGAIRPLTSAELDQVFGTQQPSAADFDRVHVNGPSGPLGDLAGQRWTGRCMVIYKDGIPDEMYFWGFSGD